MHIEQGMQVRFWNHHDNPQSVSSGTVSAIDYGDYNQADAPFVTVDSDGVQLAIHPRDILETSVSFPFSHQD